MRELTPGLGDIRLSFDLISRGSPVWILDERPFRCLMALVAQCAANLVWTYTPPGDGSLPDDDKRLARVVGLSVAEWQKVRPEVVAFFKIKRGKWHLKESWISIDDRPARFAIPIAIQAEVLRRSGKVCTYCGDTNGPFDFDHIFPVSKGGTNEPSNLTLACATCNRSKGGKTLLEWMACR